MDTNPKRVLGLPVAHWRVLFYSISLLLDSIRHCNHDVGWSTLSIRGMGPHGHACEGRPDGNEPQKSYNGQRYRGLKAGLIDRRSLRPHMALTY